ncbi:hypothetical protein [Alteromonas sp. C1M14]|uniref:hypothetical protein n=1 Tax=Alteromonas sp. C1M14 TaxID=2841567 RepID=UPI001C09245F|nr:hypothetical protein [Alteromonas sp. C1M14]MBU2979912.1 hypothetical protein [Alteromonas sp. C1M14]
MAKLRCYMLSVLSLECHRKYLVWEKVILDGNRDYMAGELDIARLKYLRAIELAQAMVALEPNLRPTVGALLVSYHNLADLYETAKNIDLAEYTLNKARSRIAKLAKANPCHEVVLWGIRLASEQIYLFNKRYGVQKDNGGPAFNTENPDDRKYAYGPLH